MSAFTWRYDGGTLGCVGLQINMSFIKERRKSAVSIKKRGGFYIQRGGLGCLGCTKVNEDVKVLCVIFNSATLINLRGFKYMNVGAMLMSVIPRTAFITPSRKSSLVQ